jgi:hypothetical protein
MILCRRYHPYCREEYNMEIEVEEDAVVEETTADDEKLEAGNVTDSTDISPDNFTVVESFNYHVSPRGGKFKIGQGLELAIPEGAVPDCRIRARIERSPGGRWRIVFDTSPSDLVLQKSVAIVAWGFAAGQLPDDAALIALDGGRIDPKVTEPIAVWAINALTSYQLPMMR